MIVEFLAKEALVIVAWAYFEMQNPNIPQVNNKVAVVQQIKANKKKVKTKILLKIPPKKFFKVRT